MISEGNVDTRAERRTIEMVNIWVNKQTILPNQVI